MCQCCIDQYSVYLISYLHQKIERICILSNTKANYRSHIPLHNFSKWIRNDNGNCCKKASKIELHGRFMATKNPLQSFLAQPWNNNVMLPLPFFLLINKKFVLIDTVHWILLSALIKFWILSGEKKCWEKKTERLDSTFFLAPLFNLHSFFFVLSVFPTYLRNRNKCSWVCNQLDLRYVVNIIPWYTSSLNSFFSHLPVILFPN